MVDYPGSRGLTTFWTAAGDLAAQLGHVERVAWEQGDPEPAVSSDLAADLDAPWRRPSGVVAYVTKQPRLEEHGFATVRFAEATVDLRTPMDPTIPTMSRRWPSTRT
jgi:hypothetical protein